MEIARPKTKVSAISDKFRHSPLCLFEVCLHLCNQYAKILRTSLSKESSNFVALDKSIYGQRSMNHLLNLTLYFNKLNHISLHTEVEFVIRIQLLTCFILCHKKY